jgi:hypothetical protein
MFAGWTVGNDPWLRSASVPAVPDASDVPVLDVDALSAGRSLSFGVAVREPVFLVCCHARRNACCARFGTPLAQALAGRYPGQVWETTHLGGHRFAANLVILPHGLYFGPVDSETAAAAIEAYRHGGIAVNRYRGRAGQPHDIQVSEHSRLIEAGSAAGHFTPGD